MSEDEITQKKTMTAREVAELLGLTAAAVFHLARTRPNFPKPYKPGTQNHYWLRLEVLAYRDQQASDTNER